MGEGPCGSWFQKIPPTLTAAFVLLVGTGDELHIPREGLSATQGPPGGWGNTHRPTAILMLALGITKQGIPSRLHQHFQLAVQSYEMKRLEGLMQTPPHPRSWGAAGHRELWLHLEHHLWTGMTVILMQFLNLLDSRLCGPHRQLQSDTGPSLDSAGT